MPAQNIPSDTYQELFEQGLDAVFFTASDFKIMAANSAACRMFGMTEVEMGEAGPEGLLDTSGPGLFERSAVWETLGKNRRKLRYKRKDGSSFGGETFAVVLENSHGAYVIIRELNGQEQEEESLRRSEEHYRIMGEIVPYGVWLCDAEGKARYFSPSFLELLDMTEEETKNFGWARRVVPEDLPGMKERWLDCIRTGREWENELRIIDRHGQIKTLLTRGRPIRDGKGKITGWAGINLDITERKRLKKERDRLAGELDVINRFIPEGLVLYGPDGKILHFNPAAEQLFGNPSQVQGQFMAERHASAGSERRGGGLAGQPLARALRGEIIHSEKIGYARADGRFLWLNVSAAPIYSPDGGLQGVVAVYSDITRLQQLQEEKEGYLHTMTHDLRAPLQVIQGYAEILGSAVDGASLGDRLHQYTDPIRTACGQMAEMIDELEEVSRLEGGELELQPEAIDLERFVADYLRHSQVRMAVSRVIVAISPALPPAWVDPRSLYRCLGNLVDNALKYSAEESPVRLAAVHQGQDLEVSVKDQGTGIPPKDLPHIFDRFFRASNVQKQGLGLGLFITRSLVEANGGRIWAESETGRGSIFHFSLPIVGGDYCSQ